MRVCPNCGKANRPERKYCIRCGVKLVVPKRKRRTAKKVEIPETGRVVTGTSMAAGEAAAEAVVAHSPKAEIVEEQWVRPSQVSRDRVRTTRKKRGKSELEKAREAFAKAESVDIEERMLRASEVKELFDEMGSQPESTPALSDDIEVSEPAGIPTVNAAAVDDSSVRLLGTFSPMVDSGSEAAMASAVMTPTPVSESVSVSSEFSSSLYEDMEVEEDQLPDIKPDTDAMTKEAKAITSADVSLEATVETQTKPEEVEPQFTVCPSCGTVMYVDDYSYEPEIYSKMGTARLKQARFFVVQGKYEEARRVIRIARSLFDKAKDSKGLEQADKLIESLARSA